jgi:hypothetical protein
VASSPGQGLSGDEATRLSSYAASPQRIRVRKKVAHHECGQRTHERIVTEGADADIRPADVPGRRLAGAAPVEGQALLGHNISSSI